MTASKQRERLILGLSNLNSAVAALLLQKQGFQVLAVYLDWAPPAEQPSTVLGCLKHATAGRKAWVQKTAKQLGISLTIVPAFEQYEEIVLDRLTHSLLQTKFRNPCIDCHSILKIGQLNQIREQNNAQWMATGHFAQVRHAPDGTPHLYRASDLELDQSDLLSLTDVDHLRHLQTPLGGLSYDNIYKLAIEFELVEATVHRKRSSRDCVWQDPSLRSIMEQRAATSLIPRGTVQTLAGEVVGDHQALYLHRLGEDAKQLHLIEPQMGEGLQVIGHEPDRKAIIIGPPSGLSVNEVMLDSLTWLQPISQLHRLKCLARFSGVVNSPNTVEVELSFYDQGKAHLQFSSPFLGVYLGQSIILYQGDEVFGAGCVTRLGGPDRT